MTNIFTTHKLSRLIGNNLIHNSPQESSKLGDWNSNLFFINRKKCLILINNHTFYSILLLNIRKHDFMNFHELFAKRLLSQLSHDNIEVPIDCIDKIKDELKPRFLKTNNDRIALGTLNQLVQDTKYYIQFEYLNQTEFVNLNKLNGHLTDNLVSALGKRPNDFGSPLDEMKQLIKKFCA